MPQPQRESWNESDAELFRLLVENVTDYAIFILDSQGHVASWNPAAERIKAYRADEIIGQHFSHFCLSTEISTEECYKSYSGQSYWGCRACRFPKRHGVRYMNLGYCLTEVLNTVQYVLQHEDRRWAGADDCQGN